MTSPLSAEDSHALVAPELLRQDGEAGTPTCVSTSDGSASIEFGRFRLHRRDRTLLADRVKADLGARAFSSELRREINDVGYQPENNPSVPASIDRRAIFLEKINFSDLCVPTPKIRVSAAWGSATVNDRRSE